MRQTVSNLLQMYPSYINNTLTKYYYYLYCFNTKPQGWPFRRQISNTRK